MGREATCTARWSGQTSAGKALLETAELLFRGEFRLAIPFRDMTDVRADPSDLTLTWPGGTLVLRLGGESVKWAQRIRNPPSRLHKLGVKATSVVALVGGERGAGDDPERQQFIAELKACGAKVVRAARGRGRDGDSSKVGADVDIDIFFLAVERSADLGALQRLKQAMRADAAVWVLRPKGAKASVSEHQVRATARAAGLVDVKVAAFSATHTADKLVIPVAARGATRARAARPGLRGPQR